MSTLPSRFRPSAPELAAEVIDDEAIIINLSTGIYYSTSKVGAVIWSGIGSGRSLEEIVEAVVARYDVPPDRARADVHQLVTKLIEENLVGAAEGDPPAGAPPEAPTAPKLPYEPPALHVYRDMGALLALDPPSPLLKDIPWKAPTDQG
jgi:hypothetical protein